MQKAVDVKAEFSQMQETDTQERLATKKHKWYGSSVAR